MSTHNTLNPDSNPSHKKANQATWWLDFWSMAGRKAENQDSLLATSILMHDDWQGLAPMLVLLADGVSASQFPKQASRIAINTIAETIAAGLAALVEPSVIIEGRTELDDNKVAILIKTAVNNANDAMYFSQSYQRVPPLLSTLSGVLCIGDRIHLMHTGDSRIYRVSVDNLTVLSLDHRINHGQDKGALSAALGADAIVELQQAVFVLRQNEYLALMTDGVYEFVDATEMQFELTQALAQLEGALAQVETNPRHSASNNKHSTTDETSFTAFMQQWQASHLISQHALSEGSNDNLSMIMLGMMPTLQLSAPNKKDNRTVSQRISRNTDTVTNNAANDKVLTQKTHDRKTVGNQETMANNSELLNNKSFNKKPSEMNKADEISVDEPTAQISTAINTHQYKLPTGLKVGDRIDGFMVNRIIARTARSEVYLVHDSDGHEYVLKSPSLITVDDGGYLRGFLKERKIGLSLSKNRRAGEAAYNQSNPNQPQVYNAQQDSAQVGTGLSDTGILRYYPVPASSSYLYHLTEFIDGESLRMFMERNPVSDIWQTHDLLTKIGMAVRVMHRNYLLHQDIKPENIILTKNGAVKLIDFGSASSSILKDSTRPPVGDLHYAAPEYYTDMPRGVNSDLFSIAIIGFELLTGKLPFTTQELMSPTNPLKVPTALLEQHKVPFSSQQALIRALQRNINVRYQGIGEFLQEFNPDNTASNNDPQPLLKRNPLMVWHGICFIQLVIIIFLLVRFYA